MRNNEKTKLTGSQLEGAVGKDAVRGRAVFVPKAPCSSYYTINQGQSKRYKVRAKGPIVYLTHLKEITLKTKTGEVLCHEFWIKADIFAGDAIELEKNDSTASRLGFVELAAN